MIPNDDMYGSGAAAYVDHAATNAMNAAYERPAMFGIIGDVAGKRVLDAGCAGGEYAARFAEQGACVTAIDASEAMIGIVRERLGDAVSARVHDLSQPLDWAPDGSFDLVCSSLTLHYVRDWSVPLREFYRVLAPGGRAVISTHHPQMFDVENYFETQLVEDVWRVGGSERRVRFYHRPFAVAIAPAVQAGFALRGVTEPQLPQSGKPWFLILDLTKT